MDVLVQFYSNSKLRNMIGEIVLKIAGGLILLFVLMNVINNNIPAVKELVAYFRNNQITVLIKQEPYWLYDSGAWTFLTRIIGEAGLVVIALKIFYWVGESHDWVYIKTAVPFLIGFNAGLEGSVNVSIIIFAIIAAVIGALMLDTGNGFNVEAMEDMPIHAIIGGTLRALHNIMLSIHSSAIASRTVHLFGNMFEKRNLDTIKAMLGLNFGIVMQVVMIIIAVFLSAVILKVPAGHYEASAWDYNDDIIKTGVFVFLAFIVYALVKARVPLLAASIPIGILFYLSSPLYLAGAVLLRVAVNMEGAGQDEMEPDDYNVYRRRR